MFSILGKLLGPGFMKKAGGAFWGGFIGVMGPSVAGSWMQGTEKVFDGSTYYVPLGYALGAGLGAALFAYKVANVDENGIPIKQS